VKQKRQAYAAFLGVMSVLGKVVGVCCIPTTILTDFGASGPPPDVHSTAEKTGLAGWVANRISPSWPEGLTVSATKRPQQRGCGLET
jgi:hypothetical protein